MKVIGYLTGF